jgi:hypothetical protein
MMRLLFAETPWTALCLLDLRLPKADDLEVLRLHVNQPLRLGA